MRWKSVLPAMIVLGGLVVVTSLAITSPVRDLAPPEQTEEAAADLRPVVEQVEQLLLAQLSDEGVAPSPPADELTVLRRLSLSLLGTVPSLEEIRRFENDQRPDRLSIWTSVMLNDPRFEAYFSERLARAFVGVEGGQFVIFRRDRFTQWLSQQLHDNVPYDQTVQAMLAEDGVWTDKAAVNFVTAAFANEQFDPNKLAGRTVRAFLGQRIDCAQCHDHPFAHWKQHQFEGLAACYGQLDNTLVGIVDNPSSQFEVEDRETREKRPVVPGVPFSPEWYPQEGTPRQRLAVWVTHPGNRRFERAIANRVWGLMFGKPFLADRPVDDIPDPDDPDFKRRTEVLDVLGADFRAHNCQLKRLIQVITSTQAFRRSSQHPAQDPHQIELVEQSWGIFPLNRLRPEQVIGAMLQSNSVKTIDQNSHFFSRAFRFFKERDYVNEFGDPGEAELEQRTATITQMLLNMNGEFAREMSQTGLFATPGAVRQLSPTQDALLDNAFLTCLTRRPTVEERAYFKAQLPESSAQTDPAIVEDLFWTLFNTEEFTWNH